MNKKFIAAFIAVFLLLSCAASAFAVSGVGIGDIIGVISSIDASEYTKYNEQEWTTLTPAERAEQLNYVINHQKGTSHLNESSDLINDSAASFQAYDILTGNSSVGGALLGGDASSNMIMKIGLEQKGYADFGMGYYNSNGHSSGKFGDGTVADTLNDDFLHYVRDNPIETGGTTAHFRTGDNYDITFYIDYDASSAWHKYSVKYRIIDPDGQVVLDGNTYKQHYSYSGNDINVPIAWLRRISLTDYNIVTVYKEDGTIQERFDLDPYIPNKEGGTVAPASDDPLATGTDENGNQIQFNINSDGVTYDGNTYNYNDDNSVTINGNTYYITVNPKDVDEDYYKQFLQQVINNYYNYYNTDSTPFDGKDILTAVKSVFTSLETFRSYCYSQLKQLSNYVFDGFNSLRSSVSSLRSAVNNWGEKIVKAINSLGGASDLSDEELANYQKKLETAVNARFLPAIELKDLVEKALTAYRDNSISQISFDYNGRSYSIDFSTWFTSENLQAIRFLMAAFIYVSYAFNTFRRIPSYINNGGDK